MAEGSANHAWEFVSSRRLPPEAVVSAVGYRTELDQLMLHRGLPSPALTLVVTLDEPVVSGFSPDQALGSDAHVAGTVLGGLHTRPAYIAQAGVQTGVQLAVRPLAARALFGVPASELTEQAVDARDVLGREFERLRERLSELHTWDDRFDALASSLRRRMADASVRHGPRPEVVEAWKWIAWHRGNGSMAELARHVHLGERQLASVFNAELGLSPKAMSRLMRFEHARQHIAHAVRAGDRVDIGTVAHRCGYYDHSHLVRDFQQYAAASPSHWIEQELRNIQAGAGQAGEEFVA